MFNIGSRVIGCGEKCFIIAEAGVNHNGDVNIAKKMVDEAKASGADAVKFQTFKAEKLVTGYASMAEYQKKNLEREDSQYNMLKKLELNYDEFRELKIYCDSKDIIFLSTPFDFESAYFLNSIDMECFKISSGDLTNIPMLEYISAFGKPIILSCGMAVMDEIEDAVESINKNGLTDIAVIHCTSNYPADFKTVNLRAMNEIVKKFKVIGGYSDHTEGYLVPIAAVGLGANIIEKHFTLDKTMEGPDHRASLEPFELKTMIESIRNIEAALGDGIKKCEASEIETMKAARKSIVAARKIKADETIQLKDLEYKRPGTGLQPKYYNEIVGKKAKYDIDYDEQILLDKVY